MIVPNESLGICLGASTISMVRLKRNNGGTEILWSRSRAHDGNPRKALTAMLATVDDAAGLRVAATGRKFKNYLTIATITEPEALEQAVAHMLPPDHPYRVIVSAGGETIMVYHLDEDGRVQTIQTGNKCASGTGEFFLQQLRRMSLTLDEVGAMAMPEIMHRVSGRCSVFCKSDCTHALNKGVPKPQVVAGLSFMMAGKILELLKKLPKNSVMLIGGCAANQALVHYLREEIPDLLIPSEATSFEALGAGLWALEKQVESLAAPDTIFASRHARLTFHRPLSSFRHLVQFKAHPRGRAVAGDRTILGLDVGSTTTKGVIMRCRDKAILAADYLRTDGDPVGASRRVYASLAEQLEVPVKIEGLGVTGSGRQIAGIHAMTDGVINEIIAHATAAVYFDPAVDTIFEIGGQDAKYTYITNGVPSDYAMNEACSAGTGSFLEESARESLGLDVTEIGRTAYLAENPPNFNDQCAAFISSDIKSAAQENIPVEDIVAGLVYSICMNYTNRVKGNRPVGRKVFIQGGVCYNEAVPVAMAALTGKEMVVPPDPGLMGAFGVALEVERRMEQGLLAPGDFDLSTLMGRAVCYGKPFRCAGGSDCDRGCEIARIKIGDQTFPFGGICNKYDNLIHKRKIDSTGLNLVRLREQRVFRDLAPEDPADRRPTIGMNRSFLVNTFFPFFNRIFKELGFRVVLSDQPDPDGIDQRGAAFCYPAELAHGFAADLLAKAPDYYFLPHLKDFTAELDNDATSCTCVFVQGEPFYLRTAFPALQKKKVITETFHLARGYDHLLEVFMTVAAKLAVEPGRVAAALKSALAEQESCQADLRQYGRDMIDRLEQEPGRFGVVLFGRSYNSFASVANKGIPAKLASRGVPVIPLDMLPIDDEFLDPDQNMYWATGKLILKAAAYVAKHPQLFGTYITNFSCGPDSFIITYFRDLMGRKPSLTLELDSHTADAGLETRIEAFLDIVHYYRQISGGVERKQVATQYRIASLAADKGRAGIRTSSGQWLPLNHDRVKLIIPAMSRFGSPLLARAFNRVGIRAEALPPADEDVLKLGRGNSSCKECLPLQTTIGSMLHYAQHRPADEVTAYFMASAEGPCRFGQYHVFSKRAIEKHRLPDLAVLSPTSMNGYSGGLGNTFMRAAWRAIVIGDLFDEMWSTILVGAVNQEQGLASLDREFRAIAAVIDRPWPAIAGQLSRSATALQAIPLKLPYNEIPKLSLIGEIYVRHDPISLQKLVERLAARGFAVRTAQNSEWIKYVDWLIKNGIEGRADFGFQVKQLVKGYYDRRIRKRLASSGLFFYEPECGVEPLINAGSLFMTPKFTCETILTVGSALHEILNPACGIISIGPFGCMPSRVGEAILSEQFTTSVKRQLSRGNGHGNGHDNWEELLVKDRKLPFMAIETDGNAFPQIIEARLEAFCLQAQRLSDKMLDCGVSH